MEYIALSRRGKALLGTRKTTCSIRHANEVSIQGGWSGGSRDYGTAWRMVNGVWVECDEQPFVGDGFRTPPKPYALGPDTFVVITGTFMGKPATPRIVCGSAELSTQLTEQLTKG